MLTRLLFIMSFFYTGLRFLPHPLVVGALKRFNLKFHQLNPSSFVKMSIYVWGCRSQGVEPDLEGFVHVHPQPHKLTIGERTLICQFGVCTFVYRHEVEVPVQAQKNMWVSPWTENWFYLKLEDEPGLCGGCNTRNFCHVLKIAKNLNFLIFYKLIRLNA
jgi:hypothetical protein